MRPRLVLLAFLTVGVHAHASHADTVRANPNDPGHITAISRGVWEIDFGGLAVFTLEQAEGDPTAVAQLSTDLSAGLQYFIRKNLSVGGVALINYDSNGEGVRATTFGGAVQVVTHMSLGLGAFFRPGLGFGALFGSRTTPTPNGGLVESPQTGVVTRAQLAFAYFASRRLLLQAGPQMNVTLSWFTPPGGSAQQHTRVAAGFAIGLGYVF